MIDTSALSGGAGACALSSSDFQDSTHLLADLEEQIGRAGSPSLAYNLVLARQALEARLRYRQWLAESAAHAANDDAASANTAHVARSHALLRRAQAAIMM